MHLRQRPNNIRYAVTSSFNKDFIVHSINLLNHIVNLRMKKLISMNTGQNIAIRINFQ